MYGLRNTATSQLGMLNSEWNSVGERQKPAVWHDITSKNESELNLSSSDLAD